MPSTSQPNEKFGRLLETIAKLRDPKSGCPWDLKQTHQSLAKFMLEEAYEAAEVMNETSISYDDLVDELGDVLLQVVLNAQIAKDNGIFDIDDVIEKINGKMIERHPHVFSDTVVRSVEDVQKNWDAIKNKDTPPQNELDMKIKKIKKILPACKQTTAIGKLAKDFRFDWDTPDEVLTKVEEELSELKQEFLNKDKKAMEDELGDLYFTLGHLCRHLKIDPEIAALKGNQKFLRRFKAMDRLAENEFKSLDVQSKEKLWKKVKDNETDGSII